MSKSFCIKTNNLKIINNLINEIEKIHLDNIYISQKNFSVYENLIIHYFGDKTQKFNENLSNILAKIIMNYYERSLLQNIINENYFYFFEFERKEILDICIENTFEFDDIKQFNLINSKCLEYINDNKSMILDGFVRFRLYEYKEILDKIVDYSINKYLIQREYIEFIRLLKEYISFSKSNCSKIHLIYSENNVILLNENNIIIPIETSLDNAKFLSDISFSKNDYCLNTILNLLPNELVLHILTNEDEFIETLKLIFSDRITICNSCDLCISYKIDNKLSHLY